MTKIARTLLMGTILIIISGCTATTRSQQTPVGADVTPAADSQVAPAQSFTLDEVAQHATASDCWQVIDGQVYDLSSYVNSHPGGSVIIDACGQEASEVFNQVRKHNAEVRAGLANYFIGVIK